MLENLFRGCCSGVAKRWRDWKEGVSPAAEERTTTMQN